MPILFKIFLPIQYLHRKFIVFFSFRTYYNDVHRRREECVYQERIDKVCEGVCGTKNCRSKFLFLFFFIPDVFITLFATLYSNITVIVLKLFRHRYG